MKAGVVACSISFYLLDTSKTDAGISVYYCIFEFLEQFILILFKFLRVGVLGSTMRRDLA